MHREYLITNVQSRMLALLPCTLLSKECKVGFRQPTYIGPDTSEEYLTVTQWYKSTTFSANKMEY